VSNHSIISSRIFRWRWSRSTLPRWRLRSWPAKIAYGADIASSSSWRISLTCPPEMVPSCCEKISVERYVLVRCSVVLRMWCCNLRFWSSLPFACVTPSSSRTPDIARIPWRLCSSFSTVSVPTGVAVGTVKCAEKCVQLSTKISCPSIVLNIFLYQSRLGCWHSRRASAR
jgi:hypothetical protein